MLKVLNILKITIIDGKNLKILKNFLKKKFLTKKEKIFLNKLNYYKIFKELLRIFKKNNVTFFLYEDLRYDKKFFSNKISRILDLNKRNI